MYDSIVSFFGFFKILNFLVLIFIFIYFVKTKFIPFLYEKNRKEKEYNATLSNEYHSLSNERDVVERECMVQDQTGKSMVLRVKTWHAQVKKQEEILKKEKQVAQEIVKKYLERQAQTSVLDYAKRSIVPDIVNNTKKELFLIAQQDKDLHQKFIQKALQSILEH